ncbi:MAG: type II secretion system GspH family protein [Ruminococcus flavefaciens]|nr:type II secretion system GspH family protein [Ruminococcus flavefaciens]MCM1061006.1 type II secretion system GspH family protein [Eubacterium sp.]
MKKNKKKLRGMTLVEVVIAIVIFASLSLVLVVVGNSIEAHQRAARKLNNKVAVQGPVAEAQNKQSALLVNDDYEITVEKSGDSAASVVVKGKLYSVEPFSVDDAGNQIPDPTAEGGNLRFIEIEKPTNP